MAKIPFDIKYRPQIESGAYRVETRDGKKVRVLCYDANNIVPVVALVTFNDGSEGSRDYYQNGAMNFDRENPLDLIIVTPEEETTKIREEMKEFIESEKQVVLCSESDGKTCVKWDTKSIDTAIMLLIDGINYLEKKKSFRPADCRYDYRFATHVDNIVTPEEEPTDEKKYQRAFNKGYEQAKKETIEKACLWLKTHLCCMGSVEEIDLFNELFEKAMREEQF